MNERFDPGERNGEARGMDPHLHALRAAYCEGRLVVSADSGDLARARIADGHAIDARDVADAMLRELVGGLQNWRRPGRGD